MQAIVLVGGEGTRLRPLTDDVPKPALTLVDRPFLAYMIEWLAAHGVTEAVLACGFLPDVLREALGEGEHAGVRLTYVTEPDRRGTAGAIRFAADALGDKLDDRFLALNGDVLTDLDLTALMRAHEERGARATIALYPVEDSSAYGLVSVDGDGGVTEFVEKTGEAVPGEINAGAYFLERSVLDLIPPEREVSIEREIFPRLVGNGLGAMRLDGYWMDIGTPERYLQVSWDILESRVQTRVRPTAPGLLIAAGAEVDDGAVVGPRAVVSPGCRVAAGAELRSSVLLEGCTVGEGAKVSDSVLAAGVMVDAGTELDGAIVGRNERVPGTVMDA
jgi:mannose-1-phosphate guanylyltransferase